MFLRPAGLLSAALFALWPANSSAVLPVVPCEVVHKGCYVDPNPARLLKQGVPGCDPGNGQLVTLPVGVKCESTKMTPEYCAQMCWAALQKTTEASGATILVGPEAGGQCFCDTVTVWDDTKVNAEKLVPSTKCDTPCTGGKTPLSAALTPPGCCGGQWMIDVYEMQCGSAWGVTFIIILGVTSALYVGGGVGFAVKTQGVEPKLSSHPHWTVWISVGGLVQDGVMYTRARIEGKGGYTKVPDASATPSPAAEAEPESEKTTATASPSEPESKAAGSGDESDDDDLVE